MFIWYKLYSQLVYQAHPEGGGGNISNYQQPREICLARKTIIQSSSEDYYSVQLGRLLFSLAQKTMIQSSSEDYDSV